MSGPHYVDTVDKIVRVYSALTCTEAFTYKGHTYLPRALQISPTIFRGFTCPEGCGGCCPRFSLDYLPDESAPESLDLEPRFIEINGQPRLILSDMQADHDNHHCRNLHLTTGRCGIYLQRPFACDFELIRFMEYRDLNHPNLLTQRLFGRGWNLLRVDDERGALCTMTEATEATVAEVVRKLRRLRQWNQYLGIKDKLKPVIEWVQNGPHNTPLLLRANGGLPRRNRGVLRRAQDNPINSP